jgi:hypothetical protein
VVVAFEAAFGVLEVAFATSARQFDEAPMVDEDDGTA